MGFNGLVISLASTLFGGDYYFSNLQATGSIHNNMLVYLQIKACWVKNNTPGRPLESNPDDSRGIFHIILGCLLRFLYQTFSLPV